ncbi:MAG: DUF4388 domain-containing protein [Vicinamibacteria bacterium]
MSPRQGIPLQGTLDCWTGAFDVPDLLLAIGGSGSTGRLELATHDAERQVFFDRGQMVFASSTSPDDRLGIYLLRRNELSLSELRRLSPRVQPGLRLGTLLVQQGILPPQAMTHAVLGQVRAIILGLFGCSHASYRFLETSREMEEAVLLSIPSARWILDGIETIGSWRRVSRGVGSLDVRFASVDGNEESLRSIDLDTGSLELLALLRHPKSVEEICASSELPDIVICRRLWAFRLLGWIHAMPFDESEPSLDADLEGLGMILRHDGGDSR